MTRLASVRRFSSDAWLALGVFCLSLAMYLPTLSPTVVSDDGGELQMLAAVLGVPHATGYPLLMLLGWLFTRLPLGGNEAFRVTLLCALSAAASAALLYLVARELKAARTAALAAALLAAAAPRIWMHASAAEVYSLANLFILLSIYLLLRWGAGKTPLWAVGLAVGFGLTHHISLRLLCPAMLLYLLLVDAKLLLRPRKWLPALACLVLPLALYAYLPLRAAYFAGLPQWEGDILGVPKPVAAGLITYNGSLWNLVLAGDYSRSLFGDPVLPFSEVLLDFLGMLRDQFPLMAAPLMLLGLGVLARRQPKASWLLLISAATVLGLGLVFLARFGEDGDNFIPFYLLLPLWFAVGAGAVLAWLGRRLLWPPWTRVLLSAGLCAIPLASIIGHYPQMRAMRQMDWSRAFLAQPIPRGAVLAAEWGLATPLRYWQRVEDIRPDLWVIPCNTENTRLLMGRALEAGQPFYAVRQSPAGPQLLPLPAPGDTQIPHPADVGLGPSVRWRGYDLQPEAPRRGEILHITLYWQTDAPVGRDWTTFIHLLDEQGERVAQVDRVPGNGFYPPTLWKPGLLVADQYDLLLPATLAVGRYELIFGWYGPEGRLEWADGGNARTLAEINLVR